MSAVKTYWAQSKATTNGRLGFTVFVAELSLLLASAVLFFLATLVGAMDLARVAAICTVVFALLTPAATAIAQGYRRAPDSGALLSASGGLWHVTAQRWEVGGVVVLDHRRCRLRSCVQRSDRPFTLPRRAVYFFTTDPTEAHVLGNVARSRARYVYRLTAPQTDGEVFQRGIAIAVAGDVKATVAARHEWTD